MIERAEDQGKDSHQQTSFDIENCLSCNSRPKTGLVRWLCNWWNILDTEKNCKLKVPVKTWHCVYRHMYEYWHIKGLRNSSNALQTVVIRNLIGIHFSVFRLIAISTIAEACTFSAGKSSCGCSSCCGGHWWGWYRPLRSQFRLSVVHAYSLLDTWKGEPSNMTCGWKSVPGWFMQSKGRWCIAWSTS